MRTISRWGQWFCIWLGLFFCIILVVLSGTGITQYHHRFQRADAVLVTWLMAAGLIVLFIWWYRRISGKGPGHSGILFTAIIVMQIFFLVMVSCPMVIADPARVQNEALAMLRYQGGQMNEKNIYMQNYPNNHFLVVLFYYFYQLLDAAGLKDFWIPSIILNMVCIDLGIYFTYAFAKKKLGRAVSDMVLVLFLLCPTTYLWLASVYTNTISFPFVMGILYFGVDIREGYVAGRYWGRYLLAGSFGVAGCFIRPTTVIAVIALVLYHLVEICRKSVWITDRKDGEGEGDFRFGILAKGRKSAKGLVKCFLLLLVCSLTWFGCQGLIKKHVSQEKFTEKFPVEHWIMMGLNEKSSGGFDRDDRKYTGSFQGLEAKRQRDREMIKQRLHHMGLIGAARHCIKKLNRVWALGHDDGISNARYAYHYPPLFQYVAGAHNICFLFYLQAFRIAMFILMGCALLKQLHLPECNSVFLHILTFLGAVCFFLIWEAGKRYNVCFNGVCLFLMADGITAVGHRLGEGKNKILIRLGRRDCKSYVFKRIFRNTLWLAAIFVLALGFTLSTGYKKSGKAENRLYYNSKLGADAEPVCYRGIKRVGLLEQTLEVGRLDEKKQWNRLKIYFENRTPGEGAEEYQVELYSLEDNRLYFCKKISPRDIRRDGSYVIPLHFEKIERNISGVGYQLRLTHLGQKNNLIPMVCKFPLLNPYPGGSLSVNGRETDWDLSMCMYHCAD